MKRRMDKSQNIQRKITHIAAKISDQELHVNMDTSCKHNFKWKKQFEEYITYYINIVSFKMCLRIKYQIQDGGYLWEGGMGMW